MGGEGCGENEARAADCGAIPQEARWCRGGFWTRESSRGGSGYAADMCGEGKELCVFGVQPWNSWSGTLKVCSL